MFLRLYIITIIISVFCQSASYSQMALPQEPNKKSIELFGKAMDTLKSANEKNIKKRSEIAINLFNQSIKEDADNVPAYLWKAMVETDSKKFADALKSINLAIKKSKENNDILLPQIYMSAGGINLFMKNKKQSTIEYENSIRIYKEILKKDKCNMDAVANVPIIYAIIGKKDIANKFVDENVKCYKGVDIKLLKKKIKEFDLQKYLDAITNKNK